MSVEAGKLMREHGGGSIINVASINGVSPGLFQGIYSVTKAAVINMTKVFAKECAQFGIRCNALLPGLTDTKFASALVKNDAIRNAALQQIPSSAWPIPAKWPARCCTWPATPPVTPPALHSTWTAVFFPDQSLSACPVPQRQAPFSSNARLHLVNFKLTAQVYSQLALLPGP